MALSAAADIRIFLQGSNPSFRAKIETPELQWLRGFSFIFNGFIGFS